MKLIGLTGGIGSGKSTVAEFFRDLGVPVYESDREAKKLMDTSPELREEIIILLGQQAYQDNLLNRTYIADKVFRDSELLKELNSIVHPRVREDFKSWVQHQKTPYVIQEAAILFENGAHRNFDRMILVRAPEKVRINRVIARDHKTEEQVRERMSNQWDDERKEAYADYIILNLDLDDTRKQVENIHQKLLEWTENTEL